MIKQHLFDIIDEPKYFNVSQYRNMLFKKATKIWQENQVPILVGGSGFYLKSLFFPPINYQILKTKEKKYKKKICSAKLWNILKSIDSKRADKINKNDTYRIRRALDIWEKTGKKPSEFIPVFNFPSNFLFIFLTRDLKELYTRINKRVFQMINEGWLEEVEALLDTKWEKFLKKKKIIGYDVVIQYLKSNQTERDLKKAIETIQKRTRNYAKRQITFWQSFKKQLKTELDKVKFSSKKGMVESKVDSINLTLSDHDLYIKQLLKYLEPLSLSFRVCH